jgi:hypothetical protein
MKYSEKLKDPRWQRKRLEVMQRDGFTCLCCGDTKTTLNVHHKQYHGDPWEAPMDSLETLCEDCHAKRTEINKEFMALDTRDAIPLITHFLELGRHSHLVDSHLESLALELFAIRHILQFGDDPNLYTYGQVVHFLRKIADTGADAQEIGLQVLPECGSASDFGHVLERESLAIDREFEEAMATARAKKS